MRYMHIYVYIFINFLIKHYLNCMLFLSVFLNFIFFYFISLVNFNAFLLYNLENTKSSACIFYIHRHTCTEEGIKLHSSEIFYYGEYM